MRSAGVDPVLQRRKAQTMIAVVERPTFWQRLFGHKETKKAKPGKPRPCCYRAM